VGIGNPSTRNAVARIPAIEALKRLDKGLEHTTD
jgi:hypothetical protein